MFAGLLLVLSACGGRPIGVMEPTNHTANGTTKVEMIAATTRAPAVDKAILFTGERGSGLMLDAVTISIPPDADREIGQVQWPKRLPADPHRAFTTVAVDPIASKKEGEAWLQSHVRKSRRVLVFVHGFNNLYEEAVYRFAQIVHDSKADVVPVVFTWPSRGSVFDYNYDKESTNYSRDALEDLLTQIARNPAVGEVTVMAHSMGTWLAVESLRQMAIRHGRVDPKISNVILASPDLDVDVFAQQYQSFGGKAPKFTLFVSRDDRALTLSKRISGNVERLGHIDPTVEPYRTQLEAAGITVLDLTKLKSGDPLNHGKFAESPEVVRLIGERLIAGQAVTDSSVGLGESLGAVAIGAGNTVGQAASTVISAPISLFDPRTRRSYSQQWQLLGSSATNTIGAAGTIFIPSRP
ncbi:alpha/beta hydrolase [Ciceribacter naphthalenivorans]|uniref:alpha/beta hydrolase n=1 Tax=Ciceribacter naphthalenivorans TaxID=1118451 RepID=UPI001F1FF213|nr:alpha/beta hydrolase [Ciceribacter naphthalenivorans]